MKRNFLIAFSILTMFTFTALDGVARTQTKTTTTKKTTTSKSKAAASSKSKQSTSKSKTSASSKDKKSTASKSKTTTAAKPKPKPAPSAGAIKTSSGLIYMITKHGKGRLPKIGENVVVHYTGTLTDGVKFDSSRDGGKPFSFPLGKGKVIKGWDEGIAKLHIGDHAILILPPALGYGVRGAGNGAIPPNATLIFVVEMLDIKP